MASEAGYFTFGDVVSAISDKMVARHPHVFGEASRDKSAEQQTADWETIKAAERAGKEKGGVLDDVALALPALLRALKLQKRAARVGFDWPNIRFVLDKLSEEISEFNEVAQTTDQDKMEDEFGDILFVLVNYGRHLKLDAEQALRRANAKFTRRFAYIEQQLAKTGKTPELSTLEEMDELWNAAKSLKKGRQRRSLELVTCDAWTRADDPQRSYVSKTSDVDHACCGVGRLGPVVPAGGFFLTNAL